MHNLGLGWVAFHFSASVSGIGMRGTLEVPLWLCKGGGGCHDRNRQSGIMRVGVPPNPPPPYPRDVWRWRATLLSLLGTPSEASPYFWLSALGWWWLEYLGPRLSDVWHVVVRPGFLASPLGATELRSLSHRGAARSLAPFKMLPAVVEPC